MKEESKNPSIDPELEARIVALVLGEACDVERDALNRLIEQRPELAAFKQEMQDVHGLLRDVGAGEWIAEDCDWKLSAEKRNAIFAAISDKTTEQPEIRLPFQSANLTRSKSSNLIRNFVKIAAVFCVVGFFGVMWLTPRQMARRASSVRSANDSSRAWMENSGATTDSLETSVKSYSVEERYDTVPYTVEDPVGLADQPQPQSGIAGSPSGIDRSLSDIRESLDAVAPPATRHYLEDDVQFLPASPDVKVPSDDSGLAGQKRRLVESEPANSPGIAMQTLSDEEFSQPSELRLQIVNGGTDSRFGKEALSAEVAEMEMELGDSSSSGALGGARIADGTVRAEARSSVRSSGRVAGKGMSNGRHSSEAVVPNSIRLGRGIATNESAPSEPTFEKGAGQADKESDGGWFYSGGQSGSSPDPTNEQGVASGFHEEHKAAQDSKEEAAMNGFAGLGYQESKEQELQELGEGERKAEARTAPSSSENWFDRRDPGEQQLGQTKQDWDVDAKREDLQLQFDDDDAIVDFNGVTPDRWEFPGKKQGLRREFDRPKDKLADNDLYGRRYRYVAPLGEDSYFEGLIAPASKSVAPAGLDEKSATSESFSTFSLHVSDVSFKLAQAALAAGSWPEPAKVRIEEFVNAFDYGDPMPSESEKVACRVEQSVHPFLQQRNVMRVSMRTAASGRASNTPLRLTFLLDNSGSMERIDRQQTVRRAFALLAGQLKPIDQVTLISFARQPRLLADRVSGAQSRELVQLISKLPSEGGTNIEAAIQLAFEKAREQQVEGAQNRIILLTDGAVNLGDANPASLSQTISTIRDAGIAFDAAGISADGLNDDILEALTRKGDGRYYLLDSLESADDGFSRQIAGALRPSAMNVKVQIEFNPKRVGRYKLLGFEKHLLKQEDFRNDQVDAAELSAAEAGVAVYQFEAKPDGEGDVGSVSVRFRDVASGQMIENRWPIPYEAEAQRLDQAAPSLRIATTAALFAAKLRSEPLGESVDLKVLANLIAGLPAQERAANRVGQLQLMIEQAREVSGK